MLYSVLLCFLLIAAWQDYCYSRISNRFLFVMFCAGVTQSMFSGCFLWKGLLSAVVVSGIFFVLYMMRVMGAADGKLIVITGLFLGEKIWPVVFLAMFFAAMYGLVKLYRSGILLSRVMTALQYFCRMMQEGEGSRYGYGIHSKEAVTVPFACCLCAGYVVFGIAKCCGCC